MKKSGVFVFLIFLAALPLVAADTNQTSESKITLAYQCLESGINNKTTSSPPSLEESTFAILALGSNTKAEQKLEDEKSTSGNTTCWPKQGCKLKDTAQALLAYKQMGKNTDSIKNYLL